MNTESLGRALVELFDEASPEVTLREVRERSIRGPVRSARFSGSVVAVGAFAIVLLGGLSIGLLTQPWDAQSPVVSPPEATSPTVADPLPGSTPADPSPSDPTDSPPVVLGVDHLWPNTPREQSTVELADTFAREVLGWESPDLSEFGHPEGRTWVRIDRSERRELVDVLTAPSGGDGRVIIEVGVPWGHGVDIAEAAPGGVSIALVKVPNAVEAEVVIRLADDSHLVETVRLDPESPDPSSAEFSQLVAGSIRSVLIRYFDQTGQVVGVNGTANPEINQPTTPSDNQAAYLDEGETLLLSHPAVVLGAPSPEPRFDTGGLGENVTLAPIISAAEILELAANVTYPHSDIMRVTVLGTTPSDTPALVVHSLYDDPEQGPMQERLTTFGGGGGGSVHPIDELADEPGGLAPRVPTEGVDMWGTRAEGRRHFVLSVPSNTSVVAVVVDGESTSWQRPTDRTAVFEFDSSLATSDIEFIALDRDGDRIRAYSEPGAQSPDS